MKKVLFFLISLSLITILNSKEVNASTVNFYEGEYISGIYMNKAPLRGDITIYFQQARFFRQRGTNEFAYCIQPFESFDDKEFYEPTITPSSLTSYQRTRVSLIAHFGYGYKNHTDSKWYAITQLMIWKASDPEGDYYFTDTLLGNRIERFTDEIKEIENLVNNYLTNISFNNNEYNIVEDQELIITDSNNVLSNYTTDNNIATIQNNKLIINNLKEGNYKINLIKSENYYNKPIIFFQTNKSQDLVEVGNIFNIEASLKINVIKTSLTINKVDSITKTTTPSGQAELTGAVYELYDKSNNLIKTIEMDELTKIINNLVFGKYYLKEIKAGLGYKIDPNVYEIIISKDNNNIDLILENEVITKKVEINKVYKDNNNLTNEENAIFDIYDKDNNFIDTIITDSNGHAEITLPYGIYIIKQVSGMKGYQLVDDINISIEDEEILTYNLTNYKIKVPDTGISKDESIFKLILQLLLLIMFYV